MKTLQTIVAIAALALSTAALADQFNGNGYNNSYGNGTGNGTGDANGDFDSNFSFNMSGKGRGNGNGNSANNWNGYNGYNAQNSYNGNNGAPYGYQPLTAEQMKEQRAAFEKAQQKAFERHQEAMKNFQTHAPIMPARNTMQMPAEMKARHDAFTKAMEARREAAQKRREEMMQRYNEARTPAKPANNS